MIHTPHVDWLSISPELSLLGAAGVLLLGAVIVPRGARRGFSAFVGAIGFATAFGFAVELYLASADGGPVIVDALFRDRFGALAQVIVCGAGLLAVGVSWSERLRDEHVGEYYALLAAAGAGMAFFVTAGNLMTLFLSLEWFSISLYILCAIEIDLEGSLEAGLKYLIVGSFGSAVLLFGSALVYGATGQLSFHGIAEATAGQGLSDDFMLLIGLAMILAGFAFKASAAPFHMWTPDAYEGAPSSVTAFMAAATKVAALVLLLRLVVTAFPQEEHLWSWALAAIATASLAIGNVAALFQRGVKRMLAYSSVSHSGFMLIAIASANELGARALLYYLIPYGAMSVGAFAVVAARERELRQPVTVANLSGFLWERPFLGFSMVVFMLGFAGLPPTGGFVGKFYAFAAAYRHGWIWLVIVGVVATAVSLVYYLGVIRAMFARPAGVGSLVPVGGAPPRDAVLHVTVAACLAVTVGTFFAVQPLIGVAKTAASALPF
ncbi:MAG TPA: NADH-quinone oxidoreductase subunit N [Gaiellaceae bacterium]|nr:NADH-quinone oxidoreductase subunit N [Gaiellaceae bacterium]